MEKVSIIVPIYNTQDYLKECLDSLVNQTYKNIEIVLVDDGSTDNSYKICEDYKKSYDNIVLIHKENGGCGSARNVALDIATGDYILDMDSDDWLVLNACEIMMDYVKKYNADVVHCEVFRDSNKKDLVVDTVPLVLSKTQVCETMLNDRVRSGALKLFKRDVIAGVRFPNDSSIDDMVFFSDIIERINVMVIAKSEVYYYRCFREDNMSNSSARFVRNVYERYIEFLKRYCIAQKYGLDGREAFKNTVEHALVFYAHYEVADKWMAERKEIESFIKKNIKTILSNDIIDGRIKFKCRILNFDKTLYKILSKTFRHRNHGNAR